MTWLIRFVQFITRLFRRLSRKPLPTPVPTARKIPVHIGFIMDGNGRWAKRRLVPRVEGHRRGYLKLREVARWCKARGVKVVTFYAFSTENWKRPKDEVAYLMQLLRDVLLRDIPEFISEGVRLKIIGHRGHPLSEDLIKLMAQAEDQTAHAGELLMQIAINYGGRAEIVAAARQCIRDGLKPEEVTEEAFSQRLWTAGTPDPDLVVRTSGERRTSGFLTWSATYAELLLELDTLWPDFSETQLDGAIDWYANRERRFGGR